MKKIKKIILAITPILSTPVAIVACGQNYTLVVNPINKQEVNKQLIINPLAIPPTNQPISTKQSIKPKIDNPKDKNIKNSDEKEKSKPENKLDDLLKDEVTIQFKNYLSEAKQLVEEVSQKYPLSKINSTTNIEQLKKWTTELGDIYHKIGESNSKRRKILDELVIESKSIENKDTKAKVDEKIKLYKEINNQIFEYWRQVAKVWDTSSKKVSQLNKGVVA